VTGVQTCALPIFYQGKGIATDCKSLAFRVAMQDTRRTLADNDADAALASLVAAAQARFGALLRQ
jgi:phenylalanyl-tRNA synthetase beta chain